MYPQLKLDNQLCFRLYTASRLITQAYHPLLEPLGITYPQYIVLMVLWENDNLLVGEISRRLMLDTNTLTPLLKRMEADGLVIRTKGIADGRQTLVSLTKKGRQLHEQCRDVPACMVQCWKDTPLSHEEITSLMATLDKLIEIYHK